MSTYLENHPINYNSGENKGCLVLALTGNIGSGKSTAAQVFKELGTDIVDADLLAREVIAPNTTPYNEILAYFGEELRASDNNIDRRKLANIVFNDAKKRLVLERIVHPAIRVLWLKRLASLLEKSTSRLIIYVVPLFFESGATYDEIDGSILIASSPETCIQRIMTRDDCDRETAQKKLSTQLPLEQKKLKANYIIPNDGSIEELRRGVAQLYEKLTSLL